MRKVLIGTIITLATVLAFRSCSEKTKEKSILEENSMLIQQQIENVSKLIVTQGHFGEIYYYKDSQQLFWSFDNCGQKGFSGCKCRGHCGILSR